MPTPPGPVQDNISPRQIVDHSATPGNVPYYADDGTLMDSGTAPGGGGSGTVTHTSGALTADLPVFGNGSADIKVGTKSGNTDEVMSATGSFTPGNVLMTDANGNAVDGGATPGAGGLLYIRDGLSATPDPAPSSPHTQDDEFLSASLDVKWTVLTNTAAAVDFNTTLKSHIAVKFTGNQDYLIKQAFAPGSADFSMTACFRIFIAGNFNGVAIYAYDAAESNGARTCYEWGPHATYGVRTTGTWNFSVATLNATVADKVYLHLQRVSGAWTSWFSLNGIAWFKIGGSSPSFTVDHITVDMTQSGLTTPNYVGCDFFRVNWLTL